MLLSASANSDESSNKSGKFSATQIEGVINGREMMDVSDTCSSAKFVCPKYTKKIKDKLNEKLFYEVETEPGDAANSLESIQK